MNQSCVQKGIVPEHTFLPSANVYLTRNTDRHRCPVFSLSTYLKPVKRAAKHALATFQHRQELLFKLLHHRFEWQGQTAPECRLASRHRIPHAFPREPDQQTLCSRSLRSAQVLVVPPYRRLAQHGHVLRAGEIHQFLPAWRYDGLVPTSVQQPLEAAVCYQLTRLA
jgi:hypothetical protein